MIIDKLNKAMVEEDMAYQNKHHTRKPRVYWPSQASAILQSGEKIGSCHRKCFYQIRGIPITNPVGARTIRQRLYGKAIEDVELGIAKQHNILLADQLVFETQLKYGVIIRGKIDAVYNIDYIPKGIEIKTVHGYYSKKQIWGNTTEGGTPRYTNLMQIMLYVDGFKNHEMFKFDEAYLMYFDRGTGESQEFRITLNAGYPVIDGETDYVVNINSIYDRYYKLNYYMIKNLLPPCDYHPVYTEDEFTKMYSERKISKKKYTEFCRMGFGQDFECEYCNWRNRCVKDNQLI